MGRFEGRRLSWTRLFVLIAILAVLAFATRSSWLWFQDTQAAAKDQSWFAGYVDVTTTPSYEFESPTSAADHQAVLSFIVNHRGSSCRPAWGSTDTLDEAEDSLDLDRRIARVRQGGGDVGVSFGGARNTELALACGDTATLAKAYRSVVDRYRLTMIDIDLEGTALRDEASSERRADALAQVQRSARAAHRPLSIWLTLPVTSRGLDEAGRRQVRTLLSAGVDLTGTNIMTMNFGRDEAAGRSMAELSTDALTETHQQLTSIYHDAGETVGPATVWRRMGATPMIGQNDSTRQVFGLRDAQELNDFAESKGLGRLSMWSLNRDRACGSNYPDVKVVSTSCSGISQPEHRFASLLHRAMDGRLDSRAPTSATPRPVSTSDDPSTSPYPIWDRTTTYTEGDRVVWHKNVYAAKWWTSGEVPDDPTMEQGEAAWELIGPVLPGEKPKPRPTLTPGTYPRWSPTKTYSKGDRVMVGTVGFEAQWWTQGQSPAGKSSREDPSPWQRLTDREVREAKRSS